MADEERRQYPIRPESVNLVYFAVFSSENSIKQQGMGRTLNISEGGILLETYERILDDGKVILSLGFRDDTLDVEAEIAHFTGKPDGTFQTGLCFHSLDKNSVEKIKEYIELFERTNAKE